MIRIGLVHAYIQLENGDLDPQTIGRCLRAADLFQKEEVEILCITVGASKNNILMADRMEDFLNIFGVPKSAILKVPRGLNTAGEIDVCRIHVRPYNEVTSISSWYHLPRIWYLWSVRGYRVRLAASYGGASFLDFLLEPLKFLVAILRPMSHARVLTGVSS